jgi:hypothetical protein
VKVVEGKSRRVGQEGGVEERRARYLLKFAPTPAHLQGRLQMAQIAVLKTLEAIRDDISRMDDLQSGF